MPGLADLRRLAALGFDFARVPLDPGPFVAFTGTKRSALFAQLSAAIDAVLATGMHVLVNVQANAATHHYTPDAFYGSDRASLFPAYRDLIVELARLCAGKGADRVALEPVNEPPQTCGAPAWNRVQSGLLTAARTAAPSLTLVATGACGSLVEGLTALDPASLQRFAPLLYTFHFYEPYLFSHQGRPGSPRSRSIAGSTPCPGPARAAACRRRSRRRAPAWRPTARSRRRRRPATWR
ncbi:glycoside hydrolase family 5 protein [Methylobacterium oryzae CBMB20]